MFTQGFTVLSLVCVALLASQSLPLFRKASSKPAAAEASNPHYISFRNNWLAVYLLNMMGDWLQGPYMYSLYKSYGLSVDEIAQLFVSGFLSSAIFGTVIGSLADSYGRKKVCLLFAVTYSLSCLSTLSHSFAILFLGRILGGISTSLISSTFESWMVSEHNARGFTQQQLSDTFGYATFLNGMVAILAGMLANWAVDAYGLTGPFMLAVLDFVLASGIVYATWGENFGSKKKKEGAIKDSKKTESALGPLLKGFSVVLKDSSILVTGLTQSLFEGSMYTFVFMWSVALEAAAVESLPYGIIFSTFMISVVLGSQTFSLLRKNSWTPDSILILLLIIALGSFSLVAIFEANQLALFWLFNLFEFSCGMYFPAMGFLRSQRVPEEVRSSVSNIFRIPLNLIVVATLLQVSTNFPLI
ncbi:hypothetical protein BC830DRAFT_1058371 [Chytriomyces sp. MP71]|nr:hypothetical protein BC830DRAFT_1058371 [Chytriomyces sp. MP71]